MMKAIFSTSLLVGSVFGTCHLECPDKLVKSVDDTCNYKIEDLLELSNCENTHQNGLGGYFPLGEHELTFTYEDQSCSFPVKVEDTTPPLIRTIRGEPNLFKGDNQYQDVPFHFNKFENCCGVKCNITRVHHEDIDVPCGYECKPCKGKITELKVKNMCHKDGKFKVKDRWGYELFKKGFDGGDLAKEGEVYHFTSYWSTMGDWIWFWTECGDFYVYTNCHHDIYEGMTIGHGKAQIVEGYSKDNGRLCDHPDAKESSSSSDSAEHRRLGGGGHHSSSDSSEGGHHGSSSSDSGEGHYDCTDELRQSKITGDRSIKICAPDTKCTKRVYTVTGMCVDSNDLWTEKETQVVVMNEEYKEADPTCANGIEKDGICCMNVCGECGGSGCGARPGGNDGCCSGAIESAARSCATNPPPCVM